MKMAGPKGNRGSSSRTPCQDNSHPKGSKRQGLEGYKSGFFHDIVQLVNRLTAKAMDVGAQVPAMAEHVRGTREEHAREMQELMGTHPLIHVGA